MLQAESVRVDHFEYVLFRVERLSHPPYLCLPFVFVRHSDGARRR